MKYIISIVALMSIYTAFGQSDIHKKKFRELEPDLWLGILDKENSETTIKINSLRYNEIPKYLDFRGTVVESLRWIDSASEKILIQTVTGHFNSKNNEGPIDYELKDKSELHTYLFEKKSNEDIFTRTWKIYDFTECYGVDMYMGYIPKATTITDVDNDGVSEISVPYVSICRGGMDPGTMKIIMYEGSSKYALRGSTMIMCGKEDAYGGEYVASKNLNEKSKLLNFLKKRWEAHKCEDKMFY